MVPTMKKRFELSNKLQGESLVRKDLLRTYSGRSQIRLLPDLNVVKIGGHGIIDYGKSVVMPLVHEIGDLAKKHQILVATGGGVRVRHILDVGLDLGMPTGVLAELAGKVSEQNAIMVSILLSPYRGVRIHTTDLLDLPTRLSSENSVMQGRPHAFEHRYYKTPHRTDRFFRQRSWCENCIPVKNVDGLFTENLFKTLMQN
jgi:molybdenum storage protein